MPNTATQHHDSKDKNPTRWTKTRLRAALTEAMSGYARQGFHYEVHIYRDMAHWRKSCGNLDSLCGDFLPWAEAKKEVAPGLVFDVYVYQFYGSVAEGPYRERELICNEVITLPGGADDTEQRAMDFADRMDMHFGTPKALLDGKTCIDCNCFCTKVDGTTHDDGWVCSDCNGDRKRTLPGRKPPNQRTTT